MKNSIDLSGNDEKVAIVVVGYNRIDGLKRLLTSLEKADYHINDVPLVISIDASGNETLYSFVQEYVWNNGPKYVNIEKQRLGLKNHIFQCGDLTQYFKAVIILEDDLYVAPDFYNYTLAALDKYGDCEHVSGISLYSEELNGYVGLPFRPLHNGSDVYAWQSVCSWGQAWNKRMWSDFRSWLSNWDENFEPLDMVEKIKHWEKAWSKFFYAFMLSNHRYFIYPFNSLTTNFNDAGGEHGGGDSAIVQVNLYRGSRDYIMYDFEDLVKYDVYQQNIELYRILGLSQDKLSLDLYGHRYQEGKTKQYVLSTALLPFEHVKTFALALRPIELNVLLNISGKGIFLYDTTKPMRKRSSGRLSEQSISYFLQGFGVLYLYPLVFKNLLCRILHKLHIQ